MPSRMSKHGRTRPTHSSHSYGWIPDVPDHRDILYASLHPSPGVSVQASVDLRSSCSPAEDQGKLGSCTANAFVGVREWCN